MARLLKNLLFTATLLALVAVQHGAHARISLTDERIASRVVLDRADVRITVHFLKNPDSVWLTRVRDWISQSANAVSVYYGRFPLPAIDVVIDPVPGTGIRGGRAFGGRRPQLRVSAGTANTAEDFRKDWIMVHEMIHMAFPMLEERHDWLTEGLAVYVESIARLQADDLDEAEVWKGFVDGMKHGLPRAGDKGLDHTPTWGRTYWGGAIFLLIADLEIRKRTDGRRSLQDALRGVLSAGGNHRTEWTIRKALETADAATGTSALMDLYQDWRASPVDPELDELWKRLGVHDEGRTVVFDDDATLAIVRKEIGQRIIR